MKVVLFSFSGLDSSTSHTLQVVNGADPAFDNTSTLTFKEVDAFVDVIEGASPDKILSSFKGACERLGVTLCCGDSQRAWLRPFTDCLQTPAGHTSCRGTFARRASASESGM